MKRRGKSMAAEPAAGRGLGLLVVLALLLVAPVLALQKICAAGEINGWPVFGAAGIFCLLTFCIVRSDKKLAQKNAWRIPERILHGLELLGGWPGSFLAQRLYRHKVSRSGYQIVFWFIVIMYELAAISFLQGWIS